MIALHHITLSAPLCTSTAAAPGHNIATGVWSKLYCQQAAELTRTQKVLSTHNMAQRYIAQQRFSRDSGCMPHSTATAAGRALLFTKQPEEAY